MEKPSDLSSGAPKKAIIKLVLGAFAFGVIYISRVFDGQPLVLLISGVLSGLVTLWGLIEVTFWFIEDKELVEDITAHEKIDTDFPDQKAPEIVQPMASIEETDKDIEASMKASEIFEMGTPIEPAAEEDIRPASLDKHYETLAEFLEDGLNTEINEIKEKQQKSPDNYALMLRLAQLYEERGETDNAIANLESCIKHEPDSAEIYLYYGTLLRRNGRLNEAQRAFEKTLELNRFMSKAFYQLGLLEKSRGNIEQTKDLLQKAIQLSPDDPYAHYQLGVAYKELGDINLAIMEVKRATILHPTDSYGHSRLGQFYQQTGQLDLAISSYSMAISLKPKDAFVIEKLAEVIAAKGDHEKAIDLYQEAIANQLHPQVSTMLSLSRSLKYVGKYADMEDVTREILRLEPENYDAAYMFAYSVLKQGRTEDATGMFEALVQKPNATYEAWLELGKLYQSSNNIEKAITAFTRASAGAPDQAGIWNTIGILLSNQKLYLDALNAFKKAASFDYTNQSVAENMKAVQRKIETDSVRIIENCKKRIEELPDNADAYYEMGRAYEAVNMQDEALMSYQRVLAIEPKNILGLMSYAEILRKMGKLKMAMRCYREIIKLEPKNLEAHIFMVNANLNLGFVNEAYKYATTAEKLAGDDSRVHFLLGKIYFAKGLAPRALKEFTTVVESSAEPEIISWADLMRRRLSRNNNQ